MIMRTPLAIAFGLLLTSTSLLQAEPSMRLEIIPQPQQVKLTEARFNASTARVIRVSDTDGDRFAAELLRDALRATHGMDCDIVTVAQPSGEQHDLAVMAGDQVPASAAAAPSGHEQEGYSLLVDSKGARVRAASEAGLFYGVQTLIQLAEQARRDAAELPGLEIVDWPAMGLRARYLEGCQSKGSVLVTRQNLEREIRLAARYKLNCLAFDIYNLVPFKSFPYCTDPKLPSLEDWNYLVELAYRHHVICMPNLFSFGQMYDVIWTCEEGKPYREETAGGLLCPSRPENLVLLKGLYKDLMEVFKYSPIIGVGCSETGMQWQEHYCPRCKARIDAGETYHDIYYKHVNNCGQAVEAAAKELGRNVRPLMWGDEFYLGYNGKRWIGIEQISKNIVMGHWQYWSNYHVNPPDYQQDYCAIREFLERGFDVFCLTASFEFNTYLHDLSPDEPKEGRWDVLMDSGIFNIANHSKWAFLHNEKGLPGKVLGIGCATFSQHDVRGWDTTWYAFALQGEYSWGSPTRPLAEVKEGFTDAFAATFYGARNRQTASAIASAFRELDAAKSELERNNSLIRDFIGEYDIHDAAYNGNELADSLKLIAELRKNGKEAGKTIQDVRQRAERSMQVAAAYRNRLAALSANVDNTYSLGYLVLAAHRMQNHAARSLYLLDHEAVVARAGETTDPAAKNQLVSEIDLLARRLDALRRDTRVIADEMERIAFGPADASGYRKVQASLSALDQALVAAKATLQ